MRIVSLEPFLTELICLLGGEDELVAVSHRCRSRPDNTSFPAIVELPAVTVSAEGSGEAGGFSEESFLEKNLCTERPLVHEVARLQPDIVLTRLRNGRQSDKLVAELAGELSEMVGKPVRVASYSPVTLSSTYDMAADVGVKIGRAAKGREIAHRWKAQIMDWADNFYERMHNKRVTVLVGIEPFRIASGRVPDMIRLCSAVSYAAGGDAEHPQVSWEQILEFRPDVVIVAPCGFNLEQSMRSFKSLEQLPHWEDLPAVKRGEVFFTDGLRYFCELGARPIPEMAILISCISGLESGYITERGSFYRLRWLELRRHEL